MVDRIRTLAAPALAPALAQAPPAPGPAGASVDAGTPMLAGAFGYAAAADAAPAAGLFGAERTARAAAPAPSDLAFDGLHDLPGAVTAAHLPRLPAARAALLADAPAAIGPDTFAMAALETLNTAKLPGGADSVAAYLAALKSPGLRGAIAAFVRDQSGTSAADLVDAHGNYKIALLTRAKTYFARAEAPPAPTPVAQPGADAVPTAGGAKPAADAPTEPAAAPAAQPTSNGKPKPAETKPTPGTVPKPAIDTPAQPAGTGKPKPVPSMPASGGKPKPVPSMPASGGKPKPVPSMPASGGKNEPVPSMPASGGKPKPVGSTPVQPAGNGKPEPITTTPEMPASGGKPKPVGSTPAQPVGNGKPEPAVSVPAKPVATGLPKPIATPGPVPALRGPYAGSAKALALAARPPDIDVHDFAEACLWAVDAAKQQPKIWSAYLKSIRSPQLRHAVATFVGNNPNAQTQIVASKPPSAAAAAASAIGLDGLDGSEAQGQPAKPNAALLQAATYAHPSFPVSATAPDQKWWRSTAAVMASTKRSDRDLRSDAAMLFFQRHANHSTADYDDWLRLIHDGPTRTDIDSVVRAAGYAGFDPGLVSRDPHQRNALWEYFRANL